MKRIKSFSGEPFYFIATPIGNLKEFTPRALKVLEKVSFVCVEDTRTSGLLLHHFNLNKELISVHKFNEKEKIDYIIKRLTNGETGAFLSDAGYPLISDPGSVLVAALLEHDLPISVINGPSAFLPALLGSGFDTTTFTFVGFLKGKNDSIKKTLSELKDRKETLLFFVAPHDLETTINHLFAGLNERKLVIARELTKLHEEYIYTSLSEFLAAPFSVKGEIVLVVEGATSSQEKLAEAELIDKVELLITKQKMSLKEATSIVALLYNESKNKLYDAYLLYKK